MSLSKKKIVHISPTPLVAAPEKISDALNLYTGHSAETVVLNDYPNKLKGIFVKNSVLWSKQTKQLIAQLIEKADVVHLHNFVSNDFLPELKTMLSKSKAKLVYQSHSPLREGPVFYDFEKECELEFDEKLVVAQYHPRLYQEHLLVPNLVNFKPEINLLKEGEKPVILFSPAHNRTGGRWNDKTCPELETALESVEKLGLAEVKNITGVSPYELFSIRKKAHITIDEIVTGAFHQISLEGMAAGNVVINNADDFSMAMLRNYSKGGQAPFVRTDKESISDTLIDLLTDHDRIRELQQASYDYHCRYLTPKKLIKIFEKIYEGLPNV